MVCVYVCVRVLLCFVVIIVVYVIAAKLPLYRAHTTFVARLNPNVLRRAIPLP